MIVIYGIIMIIYLAFYVFLFNKAKQDNEHYECESSWWLKLLAAINFIWWFVIFTGFITGYFGLTKYHPNWYGRFIDYFIFLQTNQ